jgi:adenosylmethionine-8-amino-7-oxononanoate aminotransferase
MSDLVILGTDTDAGKSTFALLWIASFGAEYDYWKPLETGNSDSDAVRCLVPTAVVHQPLLSLQRPVAPLLAARSENVEIPEAKAVVCARPISKRKLLVETFGGPFSPLNDNELQIELIRALNSPCLLVTSSAVGAVGRSLQCLRALAVSGITPVGVVLIGEPDPFAVEQIVRHRQEGKVCSIVAPKIWNAAGIATAATDSRAVLLSLKASVESTSKSAIYSTGEDSAARSLVERDLRAVWHPYTSLGETIAPHVCGGAQDEFLHLNDGRHVIDAISSWWTILHGHRHPVLMAALEQATKRFDHVHFAGVTHEPAVELAELLLQTSPWPDGRLFYSDNGSTAVEVALKMAYQYWCHRGEPERVHFVGFEHGYHGDTFGAMAVGRDPVFFGRFEPLLFEASIVPLSAERLDAELSRNRGKTAAVILEPIVQGAGGMRMHRPQLLRELAEVTRRHGVLFIADEVMTGGGRTGTLWAHEAAEIIPDLICAGKTLAGGVLPLAATLAAPHVVEAFQTADRSKTFFHGHSFTAHPLACAVGVANWKTLMAGAPSRAREMELFWQKALAPLRHSPNVREVRVRGSIGAVELAVDGGYLATVGRRVQELCLERGVLLRPLGNVIYTMPPLLTSTESLQRIADGIMAAVREIGSAC